jgi:hypothetical protein
VRDDFQPRQRGRIDCRRPSEVQGNAVGDRVPRRAGPAREVRLRHAGEPGRSRLHQSVAGCRSDAGTRWHRPAGIPAIGAALFPGGRLVALVAFIRKIAVAACDRAPRHLLGPAAAPAADARAPATAAVESAPPPPPMDQTTCCVARSTRRERPRALLVEIWPMLTADRTTK